MDDDLQFDYETPRRGTRLMICLGVVLLLIGAGIHFGQPAYANWKKHRFLIYAKDCLRRADWGSASLFARKTLEIDPACLPACRILAKVAEVKHSPDLLRCLQRIVEIEPGPLANQLDLAKVAFVQGDYVLARKAIEGVNEAGRRTPAYHEMAALVAAAEDQVGLSASHFAEAARLDPNNRRVQFNLAVLHYKPEFQVKNTHYDSLEEDQRRFTPV